MNEKGVFLFPALSLSAVPKVLDAARGRFRLVEKVNSQQWKLPDEMFGRLDELKRMREQGKINFEMKFGMIICWTEIYRCSN